MVKHLKRIALALALVFVLLCGTTVALMFQKTEPVVNQFEPAFVDCVVHEDNGKTSGTQYMDSKGTIKVCNTGNIHAYIRVRLVSYWVDAEGKIAPKASPMPTFTLGTGWVKDAANNTYYYTSEVAPMGYTGELLGEPIVLKEEDGYFQVVEVFADAIQSEPKAAVEQAWDAVTVNADKILVLKTSG